MMDVFKTISKERAIVRRSLQARTGLTRNKLSELISKLKESNYINSSRTSPFEDFDSIFITANGLSAERELNKLKTTK